VPIKMTWYCANINAKILLIPIIPHPIQVDWSVLDEDEEAQLVRPVREQHNPQHRVGEHLPVGHFQGLRLPARPLVFLSLDEHFVTEDGVLLLVADATAQM
jgi:hypothetical protein